MVIRALLLISLSLSQLALDVLYSSETSQLFKTALSQVLYDYYGTETDIFFSNISTETSIEKNIHSPSIVIDATYSLALRNKIKSLAEELSFVHIRVGEHIKDHHEWEFFTQMDKSLQFEALSGLLSYFSWDTAYMLYSTSVESFEFSRYVKEGLSDEKILYSLCFTNDESQSIADDLISRNVRSSGVSNIIILNEGEGAETLISSFISKEIYKEGSGFIVWGKGIWGALEDGLIVVVEEGLESAESLEHYNSLTVLKLLKAIDLTVESSFLIQKKLQEFTEDNCPTSRFSLINIRDGERIIVGTIIDGVVSFHQNPIFPGNTTDFPNTFKTQIKISISAGSANYNGVFLGSNRYYKFGAIFAVMYANSINFVENFNVVLHYTDCSSDYYNRDFSYNCLLKEKESFGLAFIASYSDEVCIGTINDFRDMNVSLPILSDWCTSSILTNKTAYPEFMRTTKSYAFHASTLAYIVKIFGWTNVVVIYENSTFGIDLYDNFYEVASSIGVNIINDEDKRMVKELYSPSDFSDYSGLIEHAINTQGKIIIPFLEGNAMFSLVLHFYKEGLRKGDAVFLFYMRVYWFAWAVTDTDAMKKIGELMYGSLTLFQADWVGEYGLKISDMVFAYSHMPTSDGQCASFEAVMLTLNAINSLLDSGADYDDADTLNKSLRKQRFTGCSGTVSISSDSNEKSEATINIHNLLYNSTLASWIEYPVGSYKMSSNPPFSIYSTITWPDGTSDLPQDMRLNPDNCPFNLHLIQDSPKGKGAYYGFIFMTTFITVALSLFIMKNYWKSPMPMLTQRKELKLNDAIAISVIFIDFLQYIAMGPDISGFDKFTSYLSDFASVNLEALMTFKGNYFWAAIYITLLVCALFFICCLMIYFRVGYNTKVSAIEFLGKAAKEILPIIGNLGFLPITHILLTIFQCEKGIGDSIEESYLNRDCSVYCWQGHHLTFAVISIIALIFYLPISIFCRPIWQHLTEDINIYSSSKFLIIKSIFQIIAITLNKTLKPYNQALHGIIYIGFLVIFLIFVVIHRPYNYQRCNLWVSMSLIGVIWSVSLSSLYWLTNYVYFLVWLLLQFIGWLIIFVCGYWVQSRSYPNLLYTMKGLDIGIFFKFALGTKVDPKDLKKDAGRRYEVEEPEISVEKLIESSKIMIVSSDN